MIEWHGENVVDEIGKRIDANMLQLGSAVVRFATDLAPKRTGRLATSIGYDYSLTTHTLVFTVDAPYGVFVEYGTRNMAPHPYLRPALNMVGPVYGFNMEMMFANTPSIHDPVLAAGSTFRVPNTLTAKQRSHVKNVLKPESQKQFRSNVSRARMGLRKHF